MSTFWELEISNEVVNYYPTTSAQETKTNKETNKQSSLLILTVSCEKRSCLMRNKKKRIRKLIKIIMEAIAVIIS